MRQAGSGFALRLARVTMLHDIRYAVRTLTRTPGFTAVAILSMALGIGGTSAVFSLFRAVFLSPLPFPAADRLVTITERRASGEAGFPISGHEYGAWKSQSQVFERIAMYRGDRMNLTGAGEPEAIGVLQVSADFFPALGLRPAYLGVVASRTRFGELRESLLGRGISAEPLDHIRNPAGLDIGARQPEEVALSILAEVVQLSRSAAAAETAPAPRPENEEAVDPVCGMTVVVATAQHRAEHDGRSYFFCNPRCREKFLLAPERGVIYTELKSNSSSYQRRQLIQKNQWAADREVAGLCDERIQAFDATQLEPPAAAPEEAAVSKQPA